MPPHIARFLDLASRPLAGSPALREEAKGELMGRLGHRGVPVDEIDLEAAIGRLESGGPRRAARAGRLVLLLLTAGLLVFHGSGLAREFLLFDQRRMAVHAAFHRWRVPDQQPLLFRTVERQAPDLLLGTGEPEPTVTLRERFPEDLAILQEHVIQRLDDELENWPGLADDERKLIARRDPGNALWPLILLEWKMARAAAATGGTAAIDGRRFAEALELFHQAANSDRFVDHSARLARAQITAFPKAETVVADAIQRSFARLPQSRPRSNGLAHLVIVESRRLRSTGDAAGLVRLSETYRRLLRLVVEGESRPDPEAHLEMLRGVRIAIEPMVSEWAADVAAGHQPELGQVGEAARLEELGKAFAEWENSASYNDPGLWQQAGIRVQESRNEAPGAYYSSADLKPSRMAEAALADRFAAVAGAVLCFAMVLLCGFEISRRPKAARGLAEGVYPLLRKNDHAWIGSLGIVLPWAWWWSVTRLTPLGLRDIGFYEWDLLPWTLQSLLGWIFASLMIVQTASWRWSKRGGFLGLGRPFQRAGWVAAAASALALPTVGLVRYHGGSLDAQFLFMLGTAAGGAFGLLALLWIGLSNLCMPQAGALQPNLIARTALPWFLVGALTLLAAVPVLSSAERYWMARDRLVTAASGEIRISGLDERAVKSIRQRLSEVPVAP